MPRFPAVGRGAPHYESMYLTAAHPSDGSTFWIRYTVRKAPGAEPVGSMWFTYFRPEGPRAAKLNDRVTSSPERPIAIGELGHVRLDGAVGIIGTTARWDLRFEGTEQPMAHLPKPWLYSAPVPRTKSTSPRPDMRVSGTVVVDGEEIVLDGWRGMLGHNWGSEHAHRWVWLRGAGFAESPGSWLDVVIGRIRVGPLTVPWVANGMLSLDGTRHRLGGLTKRPSVTPRADGLDVTLPGPGFAVTAAVDAPVGRSVGWEYADPAGDLHQVRNCSNAGMTLVVDGRTLTTTYGAVYELGTPEFDPAVAMQPFPDR